MAKSKSEAYSPVRTGVDPRKDKDGSENGGTHWLKVGAGEFVDVVSLVEVDEIIACEQCAIWMDDGNSPVWVYTGPDDPSHELKVERRYRAFLPILVDGESKIWSMGKQAHRDLLDIADASGELRGMEIRIKRTGSGLATRYSIVPKGKRRDVSMVPEVDVIAALGPITPEEVREHIALKLGMPSYERVLESYKGKAAKGAPKKSKKVAAPVIEDEDEDEDLEDDDDDLELK